MTLDEVAQYIMDLYYQDNQSQEDFFQHDHFRQVAASIFASVLQQEFLQSKRQEAQTEGIATAAISPEWFVEETMPVAEKKLSLNKDVFGFAYDNRDFGLRIEGEKDYVALAAGASWQAKVLPQVSVVFYSRSGRKVRFHGIPDKEVTVYYVPAFSADHDTDLPAAATEIVIEQSLKIFFQARQGVVVDMTANQNPNKVLETEVQGALNATRQNFK